VNQPPRNENCVAHRRSYRPRFLLAAVLFLLPYSPLQASLRPSIDSAVALEPFASKVTATLSRDEWGTSLAFSRRLTQVSSAAGMTQATEPFESTLHIAFDSRQSPQIAHGGLSAHFVFRSLRQEKKGGEITIAGYFPLGKRFGFAVRVASGTAPLANGQIDPAGVFEKSHLAVVGDYSDFNRPYFLTQFEIRTRLLRAISGTLFYEQSNLLRAPTSFLLGTGLEFELPGAIVKAVTLDIVRYAGTTLLGVRTSSRF
jgi:hypothetical protein